MTFLRLAVCGLAVLFGVPVWAATYYVSPSGSDSNSCAQARSSATPKKTSDGVSGCLAAGDVAEFANGTYQCNNDKLASGVAGSPVTFRAANRGGAVWAMTANAGNCLALSSVKYLVVDGIKFTARDTSNTLQIVQVGETSAVGVTFQNCDFDGSGPGGSGATGRVQRGLWSRPGTTNLTVLACQFHDFNQATGSDPGGGIGIYLNRGSNIRIAGSTFRKNNWYHINGVEADRVTVEDNTFSEVGEWRVTPNDSKTATYIHLGGGAGPGGENHIVRRNTFNASHPVPQILTMNCMGNRRVQGILIENNNFNNCGLKQIIGTSGTNVVIRGNVIKGGVPRTTDAAGGCIAMWDAVEAGDFQWNDILIERNVIVDCGSTAINVAKHPNTRTHNNVTIRFNQIINPGREGIRFDSGSGTGRWIYNNTIYGAAGNGILLESGQAAVVKNNIIWAAAGGLAIDVETATGQTFDYNLYWNASATTKILGWGSGSYSRTQFDSFRSASRNEAHAQVASPLFANVGADDVRLVPESPAVDHGVNVGLPFAGAAPDIGALEIGTDGGSPEPPTLLEVVPLP